MGDRVQNFVNCVIRGPVRNTTGEMGTRILIKGGLMFKGKKCALCGHSEEAHSEKGCEFCNEPASNPSCPGYMPKSDE